MHGHETGFRRRAADDGDSEAHAQPTGRDLAQSQSQAKGKSRTERNRRKTLRFYMAHGGSSWRWIRRSSALAKLVEQKAATKVQYKNLKYEAAGKQDRVELAN